MDLRDAIQRIALAWPSYGRPRITAELRRQNWTVNHKLVYRLMREDNLLCVRKRKFVVTTDSNHKRKIYPNLAPNIILTAPDQLWRADITYIRLREEFVFLAVILDAYSRRVIGWALDRTMEDELTLTALRMALSRRVVQAGLVHHSDRGSHRQQRLHGSAQGARHRHQYVAQGEPVGQCGLRIVHEDSEVRGGASQRIPGLARGAPSIAEFLEKVYNQKRLHSALGYLPPAEFRSTAPQGCRFAAAFLMSFMRHQEIFPSDGGDSPAANAPAHRLDEFPAGYSLAGCSPAWPASASPAGDKCAVHSSCRSRSFHPTANSVLTVCVSPGGKRTEAPDPTFEFVAKPLC